jgi:putative ABC transport system permease protein
VVGNVLRADLTGSDPEIFVPLAQQPRRAVTFLVKSDSPAAVAGAVRGAIRNADADVAVYQMRTFDEAFEQERTTTAVLVGLFVAFAGLALALAATGLYGVMSYAVSQRVQEIGIRLALGAVPSDISRLVGGQSAALVLAGTLFGIAGGAGLAQLTRSLLYGISPFDLTTFAVVTGLLLLVAAVACAVPVRRAMRVDTVEVLRAE